MFMLLQAISQFYMIYLCPHRAIIKKCVENCQKLPTLSLTHALIIAHLVLDMMYYAQLHKKFPCRMFIFSRKKTDSLSNLNDILFYWQYIQFVIRFSASDQPLVKKIAVSANRALDFVMQYIMRKRDKD